MADFGAAALLSLAKKRFGERAMREKIRGADGVDQDESDDLADAQLLLLAQGVINRLQTSLQASSGWPLPGEWPAGALDELGAPIPAGTKFSEMWPYDLLYHAILLLWTRVLVGSEQMTEEQRRLSSSTERYFENLEGGQALGIGGLTDISEPLVLTARDRTGKSLVGGLPDTPTLQDTFSGWGWDRIR